MRDYLVRTGACHGTCPRSPILLLFHLVNPTFNGSSVVSGLLLILQRVDDGVDVLLPLLDHPLPLSPAVLPMLLRCPRVPVWPLRFRDEPDVVVVGDRVLAVWNLLLSPKLHCLFKSPLLVTLITYLFKTTSSVSYFSGALKLTRSSPKSCLLEGSSSLKVLWIFFLKSSFRTFW